MSTPWQGQPSGRLSGHAALPDIVGPMLTRALSLVHIDFAPQHRQPSWPRVLIASLAAIVGSLVADALLVVIGQAVFPSTKGYAHFQRAATRASR
jgi:hypothetical protein